MNTEQRIRGLGGYCVRPWPFIFPPAHFQVFQGNCLRFLFLPSVFYLSFTVNGHHLPNRQLSLVLFQSL